MNIEHFCFTVSFATFLLPSQLIFIHVVQNHIQVEKIKRKKSFTIYHKNENYHFVKKQSSWV